MRGPNLKPLHIRIAVACAAIALPFALWVGVSVAGASKPGTDHPLPAAARLHLPPMSPQALLHLPPQAEDALARGENVTLDRSYELALQLGLSPDQARAVADRSAQAIKDGKVGHIQPGPEEQPRP